MAYDFNGTSQYLSLASAGVTDTPLTLACWVNLDTFGAADNEDKIFCLSNSSSAANEFSIEMYYDGANAFAEFACSSGGSTEFADATAAPSTGVWEHYCAVSNSTTSRDIYLNGGNKGSNTVSKAPSGVNTTNIGALNNGGSMALYTDAKIAESAIWNVALTAAEIATLAAGYSPLFVRPQSLVFYAPIIRELNNLKGGVLTNNGSAAVSVHPRIIYPTPGEMRRFTTATGGGAVAIPTIYMTTNTRFMG